MRGRTHSKAAIALVLAAALGAWSCGDQDADDPQQIDEGREIFRYDTFGDERFWTDTLRMHEVIEAAVDPTTALSVGLKVDADALPPGILQTADLTSPATTVALLKLERRGGRQGHGGQRRRPRPAHPGRHHVRALPLDRRQLGDARHRPAARRLGQPRPEPGRDHRALARADRRRRRPSTTRGDRAATIRASTSTGRTCRSSSRPRTGCATSPLATYTGDGDISYWNTYVAVTQMGGQGSFVDERIGVNRQLPAGTPDLVTPKLPALRATSTA